MECGYVHSIHTASDSGVTDIEWNNERGTAAMGRYGTTGGAVTENEWMCRDRLFSFPVQSFKPLHHSSGTKAMLVSRTMNSRPIFVISMSAPVLTPIPVETHQTGFLRKTITLSLRKTTAGTKRCHDYWPIQPKLVNINSRSPAAAIKDLGPILPFVVEQLLVRSTPYGPECPPL